MNRVESLDGFNFHDHSVGDHQIYPIPEFESFSFVDYRETDLRRDFESPFSEFVGQAGLVRALEKTRAESGVYFQGRIHHRACYVVHVKKMGRRRRCHIQGITQSPCVPLW